VEVIVRNPDILGGTPVFRGTRVPVQVLFDYLEGGETLEDFLEGFPTVSRESAVAALGAPINADCRQVESGVKVGGSNGRELIGR